VDRAVMKQYIRQLNKRDLIDLFIQSMRKPEEVKIPVSIFQAPLSSLELVVKYLKEELTYSNKKIALTIMRTPQNIWITYRNAVRKSPGKLQVEHTPYDIPLSVFAGDLSALETIVYYLVSQKHSYNEIAIVLHRNKKTIVTVYNRALKKMRSK